MKLLFDLFPVIFFFITYKYFGIFAATAVAIVASFIQVGINWLQTKSVEKMHLISLGLVTVLGGATILLENKLLIMWKVSIFYWVVAFAFLSNQLFMQKTIARSMLEKVFNLPESYWSKVNMAWIGIFVLLGAVNMYFVQSFIEAENDLVVALEANQSFSATEIETLLNESPLECETKFPETTQSFCTVTNDAESLWVDVKLFGLSGLFFAFFLAHIAVFYRYIVVEEEPSKDNNP